jgi:hypothetical protein
LDCERWHAAPPPVPESIRSNLTQKKLSTPCLAGIALGAFLSSRLSGMPRRGHSPVRPEAIGAHMGPPHANRGQIRAGGHEILPFPHPR